MTGPVLGADLGRRPQQVAALSQALVAAGARLVTAESCTGGALAAALTDPAGASAWFERGFITYSNESKVRCLGVSQASLAAEGAVSQAVACEMAQGALRSAQPWAQVAVAITGIAGPTGATPDKPVGTVWFAWACAWPWAGNGVRVCAQVQHFVGDRAAVRAQAVGYALDWALLQLTDDLARHPPQA